MSDGIHPDLPHGLDNVLALQSGICQLSAGDGRLSYRGYDARQLGEVSSYEETAFLLIRGHLPTGAEFRIFTAELGDRQKLTPFTLKALRILPPEAETMPALTSAVAAMALEHPVRTPPSHEDAMAQGLRLVAVLPTLIGAFHRLRTGQKPVLPRKSLTYAANLLTMITGATPGPETERAFDAALILRADNELNPSTFAARVAASTGADVFGSVLAAMSALAGPRHGWHARHVRAALQEIETPERVEEWVRHRLSQKKKIPGFGHVVYTGEDPRTGLLRTLAETECQRAGLWPLYRTARELEAVMERETGEHPIVDFYLAPLYCAAAIPTDLFTAVFAASRMSGWVAHILEQYRDTKLLRPRAEYIGPVNQEYRSIRKRR